MVAHFRWNFPYTLAAIGGVSVCLRKVEGCGDLGPAPNSLGVLMLLLMVLAPHALSIIALPLSLPLPLPPYTQHRHLNSSHTTCLTSNPTSRKAHPMQHVLALLLCTLYSSLSHVLSCALCPVFFPVVCPVMCVPVVCAVSCALYTVPCTGPCVRPAIINAIGRHGATHLCGAPIVVYTPFCGATQSYVLPQYCCLPRYVRSMTICIRMTRCGYSFPEGSP